MNGRKASGILIGTIMAVAVTGCTADGGEAGEARSVSSDASTIVSLRQFSPSPSLARAQGSPDPGDPDYGALAIFLERVETGTAALGEGKGVAFSLESGGASFADVAAGTHAAVNLAGGSLNGTWGFLYNSIPFGPTFPQMVDFLHEGGGIELVNRIYREGGVDVVALPVVGSPEQGSGYFRKPVGVPECQQDDAECQRHADGIGLIGLCAQPWTLRYLPPAETIVGRACDGLDTPRSLEFIQAIPGGSAFLTAVQQGTIHGFEFATPLDDYDAEKGGFFGNPASPAGSDGRNAGEIGLRFLHRPGWHQPFYLGWLVINRSRIWDRLDPDQQAAIGEAAREALTESFEASSSVQHEYLQRILGINAGRNQRGADGEVLEARADMVLTRWRDDDLDRLKEATRQVLESRGEGASTDDEVAYVTIIEAQLEHLGHPSVAAMLEAWTEPDGYFMRASEAVAP